MRTAYARPRSLLARLWVVLRALLLVAALVAAVLAYRALTAPPLALVQVWSRTLRDTGHPIALSSPNVATLEGEQAVVVGDRSGHVYAFSLATGRAVKGWPASTGGVPVDSTPSVAELSPGSPDETVFVGVGNSARPKQGGYEAFNADGTERWFVDVKNPPTDPKAGRTSAVQASLAVGDLQGTGPSIVAPSLGQEEYAINANSGRVLPGFPWFTSDSGFSTPALADLYGKGQTDIVEGGDQTAGIAYGSHYQDGGHLRVLSPEGNFGTGNPSGGLKCHYDTDQVVQSSPAVGPFLAGESLGIAVGTGTYWAHASSTNKLLAFGARCNLVWTASLDGSTGSSPALADVQGDGVLDVVEGTDNGHGGGSVYALEGATGSVLWRRGVRGEVIGGVVTAELSKGHQDVVVPTTHGAVVLNAMTGRLIESLVPYLGLQDSPLVTRDPNGTVGITLAGYNGYNQGEIVHFQLAGSRWGDLDEAGTWPMFHDNPQLTGSVGTG